MFFSKYSGGTERKKPEHAHAPDRDCIPSLDDLGIQLHPDTARYVTDSQALADAIGGNGLRDMFGNGLVVAAAFSTCMGGLLFGFDQGILSIVLTMPQFLEQFPDININVSSSAAFNKGIMTALLELGAFIGALQAGFVADKYSRKKAIALGSIWFIIGAIIQTTSFSFAQLVVGRFIGGLGVGLLSAVAPMYISEVAPPNIRGALLAMEGATIVIGIVVMFYITYGSRFIENDWSFRLPFLIQMAPCILLGIGLWKLPYSPRWLAGAGRDADCLAALMRLRRLPSTDPRLQAEWISIRAEAIQNREVMIKDHPSLQGEDFMSELKLEVVSWIDMFRPKLIKRTIIGPILMLFQQFQGVNALIYYSPTLFEQLGLDYEMQLDMSGVLNISQMVATIVAFFVLDRVGRKPPLIFGSVCNTICHVIVAVIMAKFSHDWVKYHNEAWVAVAFILIFMFTFGVGWSPVPWAMPAEVHSSSRRAKGVAITTCACWLCNFIIGLITPPMLQNIKYGTFLFFGVFSLLSGIWVWFFCPEPMGKTLEQMDEIFRSNTAHEDNLIKAEIQAAIMDVSPIENTASVFKSGEKLGDKDIQQEWVETV
ncbi:monosaccharide transporter [Cryptococcus neoformans C23]|uniref:Monosaccharide transporter n=1 Tax=Cryptococcus neoformans (strain H99 / ATCC 208821 / CBS 10515 / FGSC 9487) TaxID=235443 RepID=J9VHR3_CRYN9|nr:monosaccharide transporter [Cryptococcus neoformans var. grubii H99]AUB23552.1 monosaccharide transporter [Cryptococcus neoformans var. grubii]OWZ34531.1 monosaccharide transporter [Cryptococcus neoformans var. grubii AD2-60a]OWZ46615.1 monosaccharide transporter [Cryptococcus neoformans var. grubii C23]OWZ49251.1 monosaccharide transporter [Cryptococcus neoformans var. grubii AD1-83a]OWZ55738.1 monosaccharide transporter [Cryptococcus neoformans var. grubii 125.91]OXC85862.1 monosaccharid|eukprot:XP_012048094.1 monosaccharide transporter [Cryptococcus neoformans var. grubii H99]